MLLVGLIAAMHCLSKVAQSRGRSVRCEAFG